MPKYSPQTIELMRKVVDAAETGKVFTLGSKREAINMRQRIYNYRNALNRDLAAPEDEKRRINLLRVTVVENELQVIFGEPDYLEQVEEQLNAT